MENPNKDSKYWYSDPELLALEQQLVFKNNWLCLGFSQEFTKPGDYLTGQFLNTPYLLIMNSSQQINAFANVCLHHGSTILEGQGRQQKLVCPYHAWTYNLDGELVNTPRSEFSKICKNLKLKEYVTRQIGPFIFVNFSGKDSMEKVNLDEALSVFDFSKYDFAKKVTYKINCNWKVYVDNYLDGGYHVPHMHRDLTTNIDISSYKSELHQGFNRQVCRNKGIEERLGQGSNYTWLYPNLMINKYGSWMDVNRVVPVDSKNCLVDFYYFHQGPLEKDKLEAALEDSHQVQVEDEAICHRVQMGMESGEFSGGYYVEEYEQPMMQFHKMLNLDLNAFF